MTQPTVDELARQIERLSTDEREELLNRILLMPAEDQAAIDASWLAEAERRLDAIERGEDRPVPWEQVRGELGLK
ncbi:MAG TPA: addiction module protein [Burkholderiaceae bacterium]|nr:addiction module protein [Burkholderiaceae bacterium]HRP28248.1 addiction module protein [Burkholderiaceae bacterium]